MRKESLCHYSAIMYGAAPELLGITEITLGDSSISFFEYFCRISTRQGNLFHAGVFTEILPAGSLWSCRRHIALDRRTGANPLFATLLCALARLESTSMRPSHQTMWEFALADNWTMADSASMHNAWAKIPPSYY